MRKTIKDLPNEVLEMILNFLPPYKDLENCQLVCSRWAALVKNVRCKRNTFFQKSLQEGSLCWKMWTPDGNEKPIFRNAHSAITFKGKMYMFGGQIQFGEKRASLNDIWVFDLSTRQWTLESEVKMCNSDIAPTPKFYASMVCHEDNVVLFGGCPYTPLTLVDELHVYNLQEKKCIRPQVSTPWPPAMFGHSATIHGDNMVIFGGFQTGKYGSVNDVWTLNLANFTWQKQKTSQEKPVPRMFHHQIRLNDENLLILGGQENGPFDDMPEPDMWLLTMKSPVWSWKEIPVRQKNNCVITDLTTISPGCKIGQKFVVLPKNLSDLAQNRNLPGMMVCDLSHVLDTDNPYAQWLEPREIRISGSLENIKDIVCATLVAGNGELIHFGGRIHRPDGLDNSDKLHFITSF
ncbi:uncharacterized protein DMENIID0001_133870 [Sergentomyia squamirostris]